MARFSNTAVCLAVLPCLAAAQIALDSGTYSYSGSASAKNVACDASGTLWALSVTDSGADHPMLLQFSTDGGQTWTADSFVFNDASSGLTGTPYSNNCALIIDDQGTIHALWGVYAYPAPYTQYYRQYNPTTQMASSIVNLTSHFGANTSIRTTAMAIALDAANDVWITCQGTSSWVEALAKSNLPYASDLTFTRIGNISPSASSQSTRMAIDVNGLIHFTFYRNIGAGEYHHRYYDPATSTWSAAVGIGNTPPTNDLFGEIATDALGNLHCAYIMDADTSNCTTGPKLRYKKWDATNGWSSEVFISDIPLANYCTVANGRIFALACDEATGKVSVVYRDLAGTGSLELIELAPNGSAFQLVATLAPSNMGQHAYYSPTMRGTLIPSYNNTGTNLDITWQFRPTAGTPPFSLLFTRIGQAPPGPALALSAPAVIGTSTSVDISSPADPGASYLCGFSAGTVPGILLSDGRTIPLNVDALLVFSIAPGNGVFFNTTGVLSPSGMGSIIVAVPSLPPLVGVTVYSAFVTADPLSPTGVGTISNALPVTIQ